MTGDEIHRPTASWRPVLTGSDARRALDVVGEIAHSIAELIDGDLRDDPSLGGGLSGAGVLFAHMHELWPSDGYDGAAAKALARAAHLVATTRTTPTLFGGFPGVAWATTYVNARLSTIAPDRFGKVDDALCTYLENTSRRRDYDLVSGLVGLGVCALERAPRSAASACARHVVARLDELAERHGDGVTWRTAPEHMSLQQRDENPDGCYNLGVAHGVPGAVSLLASCCVASVAPDTAELLARGAAHWLLSLPEGAATGPGYPTWLAPESPRVPTRVAWCYGDLGLAAALSHAARCVNEPAWKVAALGIARRAAARAPQSRDIVDAGLCHGAAGVGHVFNRMYQAGGDETLGAAALTWLVRALDMRQPGVPIAGYRAYARRHEQEPWIADPGLLTGATGVALALLAATTDVEPTWDRVLLLS